MLTDSLEMHLFDDELMAEIEMVTDLMITATASDRPLCHHTIDEVLDVPGRSRMRMRCRCHEPRATVTPLRTRSAR